MTEKKENLMTVTLLASSDVHGFYQNWDYAADKKVRKGGLSKISTIYKEIKKENPHSLILDCGDLIQGNNAELFLDEEHFPGINVINKIGYEIYNMGNHEFNFGMDKLINVVRQFDGISMMGNLYKKDGHRLMNGIYVKSFGPVRIAFISLTTPLVRHFEEKSGNLRNFIVKDADIELRKLLKEVDDYKPDAVIGVFHMGDTNENLIYNTGIRDLLYNVCESHKINAIFGGHMHQKIESMVINNTIFMEPGSRGEALNRLDITFDLDDNKKIVDISPTLIEVDETVHSDKEIEKLLQPYHQRIRNYVNEHIGYIEGENLRPEDEVAGIPQVRTGQTAITDFFLEVMFHYSRADVVATQLDNPYPQLPKGEVRRKHIYDSYSYSGGDISNYLMTVKDLRDYMEWSAGFFNQSKQGDFTISFDAERLSYKYSTFDIFGNIKYNIDLTKPMGSRIVNLRDMNDNLLKDDQKLILGLNKFRMDFLTSEEGPLHDRKFDMVWSSLADKSFGFSGTIRNLSMDYLKNLPDEKYLPKRVKRWDILISVEKDLRNKAVELINSGLIDLPKNDKGAIDLSKSKNIYDKISELERIRLCNKFNFLSDLINSHTSIIDLINILEEKISLKIKLDKI